MAGPMEGIRVVELGVWVAGPAAGGILGDWGAEVIKIEPPTGDPARPFQRMLGGDMPNNPPFELDNRNKKSVVLDLSTPEGMDVALQLIDSADVFVTNLRAGALARLGLGHEDLLKRNPRLIYGGISGYGTEGDDVDRPAYDVAAFWARSGIAHLLTPEGSDPPFQRGGMGDHGTGLAAAAAISAALFSREKTGEGQYVSTSLYRQGAYTIGFDMNIALLWGMTLAVGNRESMGSAIRNGSMMRSSELLGGEPKTRLNSSRCWTQSLRKKRWTNGRRSSLLNLIFSGLLLTPLTIFSLIHKVSTLGSLQTCLMVSVRRGW